MACGCPVACSEAGSLPEVVGDATKARRVLGWEPVVPFEELVKMMVEADLARLQTPAASS
jgi:GDP-D-mannose dehydratase